MPLLKLFHTGACHLCEQARALIENLPCEDIRLEEVDIAESEELFQRYGLSIPVLRHCRSERELNWPFTAEDVLELLAHPDGQHIAGGAVQHTAGGGAHE